MADEHDAGADDVQLFEVGHQKQLMTIGAVHVSQLVNDEQFGGVAHVMSSWQAPDGHVDVSWKAKHPSERA